MFSSNCYDNYFFLRAYLEGNELLCAQWYSASYPYMRFDSQRRKASEQLFSLHNKG